MVYSLELTMDDENKNPVRSESNRTEPIVKIKSDRERGILTRTDRDVLLGEKEYETEQGLRNARHRIREHIRHSLYDTFLITTSIDQDEIDKVLDRKQELDQDADVAPISPTSGLFNLACRFAYSASRSSPRSFIDRVESDVSGGVTHAIERSEDNTVVTKVEVDISVQTEESTNTDEIVDTLTSGKVNPSAVFSSLEKGDAEAIRKKLQDRDEVIEMETGQKIRVVDDSLQFF